MSARGYAVVALEHPKNNINVGAALRAGYAYGAEIVACDLHYGDPPNSQCCAAGPTMNSEPHRVVEFWKRRSFNETWKPHELLWERDHSLETDIRPDWVMEANHA